MRPVSVISPGDIVTADADDATAGQPRAMAVEPDLAGATGGFYFVPVSTAASRRDKILARILLAVLLMLCTAGLFFAFGAMAKGHPEQPIRPYDPLHSIAD